MTTPHVHELGTSSAHPSEEAYPGVEQLSAFAQNTGAIAMQEVARPAFARGGGVGNLAVEHAVEALEKQPIAT